MVCVHTVVAVRSLERTAGEWYGRDGTYVNETLRFRSPTTVAYLTQNWLLINIVSSGLGL